MSTIRVEQAVFASSDRGSVKGYQLVSKSSGLDRTCCQELARWSPSQFPSNDPEQWAINYFPVSDDSVAVARTVLGGHEYSNRGGMQVVTIMLLLKNEQFRLYASHPMAVARTAMAMGSLKLPLHMQDSQLPQAELPARPLVTAPANADSRKYDQLCDDVANLLSDTRRVAIVGAVDPTEVVDQLISRLSAEARRQFSFTTGLSPTVRRPFQAHFLARADTAEKRRLDALNIVSVNA